MDDHQRRQRLDRRDVETKLDEEWLVLDAADGRLLGRASTGTVAAGSHHVPHPDPGQLGLSVGEGQDGVPLLWGRWDGNRLTVTRVGEDDRGLVDVSPDGTRLLTTAHWGQQPAIHRLPDGAVIREVTIDPRPDAPTEDQEGVSWGYRCGFVDDHTIIASTIERGGLTRHWLIDATEGNCLGQVEYPQRVSEDPVALGDGTWLTSGGHPFHLLLWSL
ncbi:hypothetical protein [Micromonospora siamensis]|uniref:WD40-like Beta Propeller Repeat n=1 Tax=Micromonospora siamensis TaxID=299152 RepID=A0A1C5IQ13_9ACTN|nr:hypothetical protein [Micromonospora siamensis]SCG60071.1 hypothetical protein GA0074704_3650 [Micromonospora siamensis]